jgi:hypothetical protein
MLSLSSVNGCRHPVLYFFCLPDHHQAGPRVAKRWWPNDLATGGGVSSGEVLLVQVQKRWYRDVVSTVLDLEDSTVSGSPKDRLLAKV